MNDSEQTENEHGYSTENAQRFLDRIQELINAQPSIQIDLLYLSEQLTVERARIFATQALGRRLPVIQRSVLNIFTIYPPSRKEFLTKEECTDIAIQLHAFAINVYAILDNAAWICLLQGGGRLPPVKIGLFKEDCAPFLPHGLLDYISQPTVRQWFDDYGKVYRDSTAHRIPPYLPDRNYTHEESARWSKLHKESLELLSSWRPGETHQEVTEMLARHEQLEQEKHSLGRNSLLVALTLAGEDATHPIYLHPQLLSDWGLVQEFTQTFIQTMRQHYGWEQPMIPPMSIGSL